MEDGLVSLLGWGGYLIYKFAKLGSEDFLYCKADKFYLEGKYKKSLEAINLSIDTESPCVLHYLLKGKIKYELKKYKSALKNFKSAVKICELTGFLPECYLYMGNSSNLLENHEHAINYFNKGIQCLSINADESCIYDLYSEEEVYTFNRLLFCQRGIAKYELGHFRDAIDDFDQAIQLNPDNSEPFKYRGVAKYDLEEYKGAIKDFDQAIQLNPDDYEPFKFRGIAKHDLEKYKGAIKDFDQAIQLNPDDSECYEWKDFIIQKINIQSNNIEDEENSSKDLTKTILIVEDEISTQIFIKNVLKEKSQHKIISVSDARDALSLIKANKIDLVITDVMLPGMDGISLSSEIRKFNNSIEIIWISALKSNQFGENGLTILDDLKISKVFSKPFDPKDLKNFINSKLS